MANLTINNDGLIVRLNARNRWIWEFFGRGILIVWSMRDFDTHAACMVHASNSNVIL